MYIRPRQGLREQMSASQFMAPSNQELTMAHLPHAAAAGDCRRVLDTTQHSLLNMDQMMQPEAAAAQLMQRAEALQAVGDSHAAVQVRQAGAECMHDLRSVTEFSSSGMHYWSVHMRTPCSSVPVS
jgi:hypothetical protein